MEQEPPKKIGTRLFELRRSNAASKHGDKRTKKLRDRKAIRDNAIKKSSEEE